VGAFGGALLAAIYASSTSGASASRRSQRRVVEDDKGAGRIIKESSFLTAKTSAMCAGCFVRSGIFRPRFALLGGQEVVEKWVLSLNMTPVQL